MGGDEVAVGGLEHRGVVRHVRRGLEPGYGSDRRARRGRCPDLGAGGRDRGVHGVEVGLRLGVGPDQRGELRRRVAQAPRRIREMVGRDDHLGLRHPEPVHPVVDEELARVGVQRGEGRITGLAI